MKIAVSISVLCVGCGFSIGELAADEENAGPFLPPPGQVGDWSKITERFMKWEIVDFRYGGGAADGGSDVFEFKTSDGSEFELLVASDAWWTKEDRDEKRQPVILWHEKKAYRFTKGGKAESRLLEILKSASTKLQGEGCKHPKFITRLREMVNAPIGSHYDGWPYDRLEVEGDLADWGEIREQIKQWKVVQYERWDLASNRDLSENGFVVFRFRVSESSNFGVVVERDYPDLPVEPFAELERKSVPLNMYLHLGKRLYRIEKNSEFETAVLDVLSRATTKKDGEGRSQSKYLERLREVSKSRVISDVFSWPADENAGDDE